LAGFGDPGFKNHGIRPGMNCTVLLPVFNAGRPLSLAIESILSQEHKDFEFLIIDDRSTDESVRVIEQYASKDDRIRPVYHAENRGLASTLNEGLALAGSSLIVRMDQDDEALPRRIGIQVEFMRENPGIAVAGSFVYHMGAKPEFDRLVQLPVDPDDIANALRSANCIYHPSVIFRRETVLESGGYRSAFKNAEDYDLWLRLARTHRIANIPQPLLRYRFSTAGMTLGKKWQQMYYVKLAMLSNEAPDRPTEELAQAATEALAELGKEHFLEQVALGTVRELVQLHLWRDALTVFWMFSRQLPVKARLRVVQAFAGAVG
jgi:glycosyltransferase involved in cell wall biosynthesis